MPVLEVIRSRRGDCTEHADLLTTLCRAARIPCRNVAGLMYVADAVPAFAGHAWNEVVLDGVWTPVDATWNQTRVDATHLRYPLVASESMRARSLLPGTVFRVESTDPESLSAADYARRSIWYDAFAVAAPRERAALLGQVGLSEAAAALQPPAVSSPPR